ncbi:hypothetical protein ALC57_00458, partial [Trachymyrmex cornetzi]
EDVITYANRIKILGKQILEAHRNSETGFSDQNIKASLEKDMCKCFIRKLKPKIEQRIARNLSVQDTVACDKSGHLAVNCWQRQNFERNFDNKTKIICHICNNSGHIATDCRSKSNQQSNSKNSLFCRYCKETGHLLELCQLRIASNNRRKTIIASPRLESLFCVRVENPEIIRYIPRIKIAHGIYLGDTIVENVSGKAYLNVISTLDEEVEVQVPTMRLKPLDELFDNKLENPETQEGRTEIADMQVDFT